jgi:hypothetical protein
MTLSTTTDRVYRHLSSVRMLDAAAHFATQAINWRNTRAFCLSLVVALPQDLRDAQVDWEYLHDKLVLDAEMASF